ncbi:ATP-dependent helicase [Basilea psittacipulmonis]|uniref:ATP-dependent helicase n=1 Tax=Basilea psittacipulmonis TaxID=1472345 RepID=UPI00068E3F8E|nr:UvrD-helicase domain-containing protein [Basilea psittacipulmonis]
MIESLNEKQKQAVQYMQGPCLVLAGAGSGKTKVITQKIVYLIKELGMNPKGIFALTFTNKAAQEMVERIQQQLPVRESKRITVCTFHSLGVRFLREEGHLIGLKRNFTILDSQDVETILKEVLTNETVGLMPYVKHKISIWKNAMISPQEAEKQIVSDDDKTAVSAYISYQKTLESLGMVDFDDLIAQPVKILKQHESVLHRWQERVQYLLVDEYQDTNVCQYEWIKMLTNPRRQFTLVGDDDQAIYAWRGATLDNLKNLQVDYPDLNVIALEQNYRSVSTILTAANNVIRDNPKLFQKKLWSNLGEGEPIEVFDCFDDQEEVRKICEEIRRLKESRNLTWGDFAILYRSNAQSRKLEEALRRVTFPYSISGGQSFFEKSEIRDILAWLRLISNGDDDMAFVRAITSPKRGVGNRTLTMLSDYARATEQSFLTAAQDGELHDQLAPAQLNALQRFVTYVLHIQSLADNQENLDTRYILEQTIKEIQYEQWLYGLYDESVAKKRWQNVLDLVQNLGDKAQEEDMSLSQILQYVSLITMLERKSDDGLENDAIKLSTIHASKGLEYPYVFIMGCEEGYLPFFRNEEDDELDISETEQLNENAKRVQEERRLMYVAVTRAKYYLALTWSKSRKGRRANTKINREPSRFIREMGLYPSKRALLEDEEHLPASVRLQKLLESLA